MRKKKTTTQKLRDEADALCTPVGKKFHPKCELCGAETEVAHHFYHKSQSNRLRYEPDNLIGLCTNCHCKLHHNENIWSNAIRDIRGEEWYRTLTAKKYETIKTDKGFYEEAIIKLTALLQ
jgi:5-methylcytosine-specific restriction endonuclease McrA